MTADRDRMPRLAAPIRLGVTLVIAVVVGGGGASAQGQTGGNPVQTVVRGAFGPRDTIAVLGTDSSSRRRVGIFATGGGSITWFTPPNLTIEDFAWMPGGNSVLVAPRIEGYDTVDALVIVRTTGLVERTIPLSTRFLFLAGMGVNQSGTRAIVAASNAGALNPTTDLYLVNLMTGRLRQLTRTVSVFERAPTYRNEHEAVYAFQDVRNKKPNGRLAVVDTVSKATRVVDTGQLIVGWPTASLSNGTVVFDAESRTTRRRGLWKTDFAQDGRLTLVRRIDVSYPSLSPNGRRVLVRRADSSKVGLSVVPVQR